jgi:nucleotide-binding universal stress UspA family protein
MTRNDQRKILLAMDGFDYGFETARYISGVRPFQNMKTVLFNVFSKIPERYWDMEREPQYGRRLREIRFWEVHREQEMQKYMERARQIFLDAGFSEDSVIYRIHKRDQGVARDILKEARRGYTAVVIGRKGMSKLKELVPGSVATKLFEKLAFAPLVIVGKGAKPGKVLLALDRSEGAMRAVDFVATTLGTSGFEINMTHVVRGDEKEEIAESEIMIGNIFDRAKSRLMSAGIRPQASMASQDVFKKTTPICWIKRGGNIAIRS